MSLKKLIVSKIGSLLNKKSEKYGSQDSKTYKVLIAAGGSGGHLIPAQQLAERLREKKIEICFAGRGLDSSISFQRQKFAFKEIVSGPLKQPLKILNGFFSACLFLKKYQPQVVVGFGSYHSFPVLLAAVFLGKKIVLFEANTVLGRVNRFFAGFAKVLALQFPLMEKQHQNINNHKMNKFEKKFSGELKKNRLFFKATRPNLQNTCLVKPMPWSQSFSLEEQKKAKQQLGLDPAQAVLFMFGGSQGADFLNDLICRLAFFWEKEKFFQIIHLAGSNIAAENVKSWLDKLGFNSCVASYFQDMGLLFSAANIVASRAGAGTLAEIVCAEKPALLIPFPYAKDNHQSFNADFLQEKIKGGQKIVQSEVDIKSFSEKLLFLWENEKQLKKNFQDFKQKMQNQKRKSLDQIIMEFCAK